jgi:DNA-binding response OmpR family regulator
MRVLLVEDSEKLRRAIDFRLRKAGYAVDATGDGAEGLWYAETNDYDAVVLDWMLPGMDGVSVVRRLRASGRQCPVLLLTIKSDVAQRVEGLRAGADDYLCKPFAMEELLARVAALVRRRYGNKDAVRRIGRLELDTLARCVRYDSRDIFLNPREYRVLELLVQRAGEVVSPGEIEQHIYADDVEVFSNAVESAISVLRKRLADAGALALIRTRRGMGYVLEVGAE